MVSLHFQLEFPDQKYPLAHMHSQLLNVFDWQEPTSSKLQRDVALSLTRIGWNHAFEYETPEGLSIDMAQPETKIAIEVDGPSHYFKGTNGHLVVNGSTKFKARLLGRLGWTIVHVPYFEWGTLLDTATQDSYLRMKLR
mmetsp:Transcript_5253/g.7797  ORF Transcript_5253/g.7797 Transcript_5253/m.7797 type:complete len:139 (-) Transcript_5253:162-578(-)